MLKSEVRASDRETDRPLGAPVSYIVIQSGEADQSVYREFADIESAAAHIELACNGSGATEVRLCRIEPVEFQVKQYFKVELPSGADTPVATEPEPVAAAADVVSDEVAVPDNSSVFESLGIPETSDFQPLATRHDSHLTGESRRGLFGR